MHVQATTTLIHHFHRQLLSVLAGEPYLSQRLCSACSPLGWQQERVPEGGSRVRLIDGLQAPRPLDLCHTRTGCSVALGSRFFIGEGEAWPHHRLLAECLLVLR